MIDHLTGMNTNLRTSRCPNRPALDALLRLEGRQPSSQSDYELVSGLREHVLGFGAFKEPALGRAYSEHVIAAARAAAAAAAAKKKGSKKGKGAAGAGQQEAPLPPPVPALARFEGGCTVQVGCLCHTARAGSLHVAVWLC